MCVRFKVPFPLALRLWDIYLYEGERVLVAMSYTLIKMHRSEFSWYNIELFALCCVLCSFVVVEFWRSRWCGDPVG